MPASLEETQAMLDAHHRDGATFAQMMKDSFSGRFGEAFWNLWADHIAPKIGDAPTILDLGTGPGLLLRAMHERYPKGRAVGVECADYMFEAAGELPNGCEILRADLHEPSLALKDGEVDAAVASAVLHEMHQPVRALQEVWRCLRPGGMFYVFDWVRAPLKMYLDNHEADVFGKDISTAELEDIFVHFIEHNRFSVEDLQLLLTQTGFEIIHTEPVREGRMARLLARKK